MKRTSFPAQRHVVTGIAALLISLSAGCRSTPVVPPAAEVQQVVAISIAGNDHVEHDTLRTIVVEELFDLDAQRPTKAAVDDAAYALEIYYLAHGFPDVSVAYTFADPPGEPVRAHFAIEEGPAVLIGSWKVSGAGALKSDVLTSFFGETAPDRIFVRTEIASRASQLRDHYLDLGYLRAQVDVRVAKEARRADVEIVVNEGAHFRVRKVLFPGGLPSLDALHSELAQRFVGRTYTPRLAYELRSMILSEYAQVGYPDALVRMDSELDESSGDVDMHMTIEPGALVFVGAIRVQGNDLTRAGVVVERIMIQRGDRYDARQVRAGVRQLYVTGLFRSVSIKLDNDGAPEARDLLVRVVELPSREVRVEPGYGSYEGPRVAVALEERNLFGTARQLSLTTHLSDLARGARLTVADTHFLGRPQSLSASIFTEEREEPSFEVRRVGTDVVLRRRWDNHISASVGYQYRLSNLVDVDGIITSEEQVDEPDVSSITTSVVYDARDNILLPSAGTRARLRLEWADRALGSELDALWLDLDLSHIFPLKPGVGIATVARTHIVAPIGDTDVLPIQERAFNGGENSVRSFREDGLGPLDAAGHPIGGEASTFLSMELRHVIVGNFSWAAFFDAGNVQLSANDYLDFDGFRYGVGVGLRYALPIGPVRLDLGFNPNARSGEDDFVLHFSVGFPF